jgi:hypothetical protein
VKRPVIASAREAIQLREAAKKKAGLLRRFAPRNDEKAAS